MDSIFLIIYIFFDLLYWLIIIDIILSWLNLTWINFKIKFIESILNPIYERIRNTVSTTFWIFDLTPIILIIFIIFIKEIIRLNNPEIIIFYNNFFNIF